MNRINRAIFLALFGFVLTSSTAFGQPNPPKSITDAKNELTRLYVYLSQVDADVSVRMEQEISKQVSTSPKDEFETTKQYSARFSRANLIRSRLRPLYETERRNRRAEIQQKITAIYDMEFTGPAAVQLDTYDADKGYFDASVKDFYDVRHTEIMPVPQARGRRVKEIFDTAEITGLYGVRFDGTVGRDYYFGFRAKVENEVYSSLPPPVNPRSKADMLRYYKVYSEPTVIYLRKVIDAYLFNRNSVSELEQEALDQIDRSYLRSKFVVYWFEPFLAGGKWIKVIFVDRPDSIFAVWIYRILELRAIEKEDHSDREMRIIRLISAPALKDKVRTL